MTFCVADDASNARGNRASRDCVCIFRCSQCIGCTVRVIAGENRLPRIYVAPPRILRTREKAAALSGGGCGSRWRLIRTFANGTESGVQTCRHAASAISVQTCRHFVHVTSRFSFFRSNAGPGAHSSTNKRNSRRHGCMAAASWRANQLASNMATGIYSSATASSPLMSLIRIRLSDASSVSQLRSHIPTVWSESLLWALRSYDGDSHCAFTLNASQCV